MHMIAILNQTEIRVHLRLSAVSFFPLRALRASVVCP